MPTAALPARRPPSPGADTRNAAVPYQVHQYADEIIDHLMQRERTTQRDANYLANQPDVTERMRVILMDWLIDVHLKFKLHPGTYFLAVDYVDRYLMCTRGARASLPLVGVCAILIAAKHEEIWPPEVRECIYISANTYTRDEILQMERDITAALRFRLCVPTPFPFMGRLLEVTDASDDSRSIAAMLLDVSTLDYGCLQYVPSQIGYATVLVARYVAENARRQANGTPAIVVPLDITGADALALWPSSLEFYAKTPLTAEIVACANSILATAAVVNSPSSRYHAIKRKYTAERFNDVVSRYVLPQSI